ncbi:MAG: hypothetical protein E6K54_05035 [Gammaproteobacteria bacterium]|nr:MAG: hypothetical protein E6K54_05035 [Gammaproteobacteria bacterium]
MRNIASVCHSAWFYRYRYSAYGEFGAEVNTQDKWDNTPLHEAVNEESSLLVKELLSRNANLLLKNNLGETPGSLTAR